MENLQKITSTLKWSEISDILNHNLNSIVVATGRFSGVGSTGKGLFSSLANLTKTYSKPQEGWFAYIYDENDSEIYLVYAEEGSWVVSGLPITNADNLISLKPYVSMESGLYYTKNIPALLEKSGGAIEETILEFIDGKLRVPGVFSIAESYGGPYTNLTWDSDGILQVPGLYTLQICTLGEDRRSRGMANPTFLDFVGGKLVDIR